MRSLLEGFAAEMSALPWPGNKPSDRPVLRRVDIDGAHTIRTSGGSYPVLQVNDETVRVRTTWGWLDIPFNEVLGVTL